MTADFFQILGIEPILVWEGKRYHPSVYRLYILDTP